MTTVTQTDIQQPAGNIPKQPFFGRVLGGFGKLQDVIGGYAKSRFNSDNWFGSCLLPWMLYNGYTTKKAGERRTENGKSARDLERKLGGELFMIEKTYSFFSTRGGTFPKGKNALQRILNAFKHPLASSTQFEWLLLVAPKMLSIKSNLTKGSRAFGLGLNAGETPYKEERVRLINGLAQIGAFIFTGYGHFRNHDKKPDVQSTEGKVTSEPQTRHKNPAPDLTNASFTKRLLGNSQYFITNIPDMAKQMWQKDRLLLIGSLITMFIPSLNTLEGKLKEKISPDEAAELKKSGLSQFLVNVAYTIYTMQRIDKGNYKTDNAATGTDITPEDIEQIEEGRGAINQPAAAKTFASRFPEASVRNADKAGLALAA